MKAKCENCNECVSVTKFNYVLIESKEKKFLCEKCRRLFEAHLKVKTFPKKILLADLVDVKFDQGSFGEIVAEYTLSFIDGMEEFRIHLSLVRENGFYKTLYWESPFNTTTIIKWPSFRVTQQFAWKVKNAYLRWNQRNNPEVTSDAISDAEIPF